MVRQFIANASLSLRAIPLVTQIFARCFDRDAFTPSASAARWWLQRLGLFSLRETLPIANDWFYLIVHSIQIGTVKLCVIVGID